MSTPDLPDDPRDWPADPFALLGVGRGASETDVKRAYTRLIRRFKPEHHPDQFRRIREAYEACLDGFRWLAPPPDHLRPDRPSIRVQPTELHSPSAEPSPSPGQDPAPEPKPTARPVDEVDRLWAAAIDGRADEAYAELARLSEARPDRADLPLRLYWLLGLHPALDATRTRHDWLAAALRRSRLTGPAAELYRRELDADPERALYGPFAGLLAADADPRDLLAVARWRLTAAGRTLSWNPAAADLTVLAKVLPFRDEGAWLGHLTAALDWAAWERPSALDTRARAEVGRLGHLHLTHADYFDRVEETEHAAAAWRRFLERFATSGVFTLLPHAWADPAGLDPEVVGPGVVAAAANPVGALAAADRAAEALGAGLVVLLARALDAFYHRHGGPHPDFPPDLIRGLVQGRRGRWGGDYLAVRADLLDYLLAEVVHPAEFAEACGAHPDRWIREIADACRRDVSLWLVWLAGRLHRGPG